MTAAMDLETPTQLAGRLTTVSGVLAAVGIAFLIAMFSSFAVGATSAGMVFGWINDVLVLISYLLTAPAVLALLPLLRSRAPTLSVLVALIGLLSIAGIVFLQLLLVVGVLTFEQQSGPVSVVYLGLAVWLVVSGYLGRVAGILPDGVRWGILAATYVGYPFWAFRMGRLLRQGPALAERDQAIDVKKGLRHV